MRSILPLALAALVTASTGAADEVRLKNGDELNGSVVSLDASKLVLKSDTLGEITIDRSSVVAIGLGPDGLPETVIVQQAAPGTAAPAGQLGDIGSLLQNPQVQQQFGTLLQGALGGQSMGDVQGDLRRTQQDLRELSEDLGGIEGEAIGSYLKLFDVLGTGLDAAGSAGGLDNTPPPGRSTPPRSNTPPRPNTPQAAPAPAE